MAEDIYFSFGADTGALKAANAKARAEVRGLTAEMNSLGREMQKTGADMDSALGAKLNALGHTLAEAKAHMAELSATLREHAASSGAVAEETAGLLAKFRQMTEGVTGLHEAFSSASETFAAFFAVDQLKEFINKAAEAGEAIDHMAHFTGLSVEQVQRLQGMARLAGLDVDSLTRGIARMTAEFEAEGKNSRVAKGLAALNVNIEQFERLDFAGKLKLLSEAYESTEDGGNKAAASMALLRSAGDGLVAFLDRGPAGLAELNAKMTEIGVSSAKDVDALDQVKEAAAALSLATDKLGRDLVASLKGPILDVVGWLDGLVKAVDETEREFEAVLAVLAKLNSFRMNDAARLAAAGEISTDALLGGNVTVRPKRKVAPMQDSVRGAKPKADHSEQQEAEEAYQTQVEAAQIAADKAIDADDNAVKQHKIGWDEWAKDSVAALEQEKAAIQAAANTALQSASLTSIEKQRIMNEEARALTEISKKEADDQAKAAEETTKAWDSFFKPFNAAIESQIGQVISGHEKMGQALKKTLDTMLADVLKFFLQWGLKAAENVVAQVAGNNLIAASQQAGSVAGLGTMIANAMRAITIDAGQTAAGVTAFMAPLTGPAAVGVGEAAGATVLGMAAFDVGAWKLPSDQIGLIHQNELIMPAAEAGAFRSMLSTAAAQGNPGAGNVAIHPTTIINHSSVDGASTAQFFRQNGFSPHEGNQRGGAPRSGSRSKGA